MEWNRSSDAAIIYLNSTIFSDLTTAILEAHIAFYVVQRLLCVWAMYE